MELHASFILIWLQEEVKFSRLVGWRRDSLVCVPSHEIVSVLEMMA